MGAWVCHAQNVMKFELAIDLTIAGGWWWIGGSALIQHPPGGGSYSDLISSMNQRQQTRSATMWNQSRVCCLHACQCAVTCSLIHTAV